jgi:hypothetical protein
MTQKQYDEFARNNVHYKRMLVAMSAFMLWLFFSKYLIGICYPMPIVRDLAGLTLCTIVLFVIVTITLTTKALNAYHKEISEKKLF